MGMSLDDLGETLSWYDLLVLMQDLVQLRHDSALFHAVHGAYWSTEGQLLAVVADALHLANWQRGGKRSAPKPKPIKRPWEKIKGTTVGKDPIAISKFNDWWDQQRTKVTAKSRARKSRKLEKPPTA